MATLDEFGIARTVELEKMSGKELVAYTKRRGYGTIYIRLLEHGSVTRTNGVRSEVLNEIKPWDKHYIVCLRRYLAIRQEDRVCGGERHGKM